MRAFLRRGFLPLLLVSTLLIAASIGARSIDRTIVKINDDILTESDLEEVIADLSGQFNARFVSAFDSATSEAVASMLDRALLQQEARRLKISPPEDELNSQVEMMVRDIRGNFGSEKDFHQALAAEHISLEQLKTQLLEKVKTDFLVFHVVNSRYSVSEDEVQKFQAQQAAEGENVESFRLRRLGIPVTKNEGPEEASRKARAIVARIITEGISFEEGIRQYSQVPGAAADGGDMGYMSKDKLSSEVRTAVENLEVGQASAPVVAGSYANIFYMDGKRGARSAIRERKFFEARNELLSELRRKAILQVFDDRLLKLLPGEYLRVLKSASQAIPAPAARENQGQPAAATPVQPNQQYYANPQAAPPAASPTPAQSRLRRWFGNGQ